MRRVFLLLIQLLDWLWRFMLFPLIGPILMAPIMLVGFFLMPLQLFFILGITVFVYVFEPAAWAFAGIANLYYFWHISSPPTGASAYRKWEQNYAAPAARTGSLALTTAMSFGFLVAFTALDFHPILRWLAALGIGYYIGSVIQAWIVAFTAPSGLKWLLSLPETSSNKLSPAGDLSEMQLPAAIAQPRVSASGGELPDRTKATRARRPKRTPRGATSVHFYGCNELHELGTPCNGQVATRESNDPAAGR
jgi:hypothetical protein